MFLLNCYRQGVQHPSTKIIGMPILGVIFLPDFLHGINAIHIFLSKLTMSKSSEKQKSPKIRFCPG
jgi:succinate dehydrogenase/fumarate reductase cytochrome b subunit